VGVNTAPLFIDIDIYLSTAIGLAPGSSTHLHAIHRTSQLTTKNITNNIQNNTNKFGRQITNLEVNKKSGRQLTILEDK
jgi:hypothetical protein